MAKLFTPGPLNTSMTVKEAMLHDLGSRDKKFIDIVADVRGQLVKIAGGTSERQVCVPLQGAGSYAVEAVFANVIGRSRGKKQKQCLQALILANGAYAYRMITICEQHDYRHTALRMPEENPTDLAALTKELKAHGQDYSVIAAVHCETSTGIINPISRIAKLVAEHSETAVFFVDSMSGMGAIPINITADPIHFLVSSANKCLQGVPGFSYVIADRSALQSCKGNCTSWAFDLCAQAAGLESNGQFRCTPPTHSILAFNQALKEFNDETLHGRITRSSEFEIFSRYKQNNKIIRDGMNEMGFRAFDLHLPDDKKGYIITGFHYPSDEKFDFATFYTKLSEHNLVIYPGKVSKADTFRLGNIGDLHPSDCTKLIHGIKKVLTDMGVKLPVNYEK